MQPSYDADDFMRRGFFGSIIGFRKRSSSKTEPGPPAHQPKFAPGPVPVLPGPGPVHLDPHHLHPQFIGPPQNRTEYEIYREIVSEAEYIQERSPLTSPDFSCPTTPQPSYNPYPGPQQHLPPHFDPNLLMHQPQEMMPHAIPHPSQYHMVMSPHAPHPIPVDTNGVPLGTQCPMAPPPYSSFAPQSSAAQMPPMPQQMAAIPFDVKREIQEHMMVQNGKQQMSIEEIVKLVVVALKDSQIEESREEESPEEILRRKRIQNNLAAARYRKRQREARECAEQELGELTRRNDELREQVGRMEMEIGALKRAVLERQ
ncbi:unnamed protein product [Caenorhabditis sp. 36 PRJEB53466]|nr:unnamed protein product [Caenorhabditis sp. 36 PRJEB53466]